MTLRYALFGLITMTALCACSGAKQQSQAGASPSALPTAAATPIVSPSVAATVQPAPATPAATSDPTAAVKYTDIAGSFAETAIKQLAALGVFGSKTGAFHPDNPVTREQYVRWLVTLNNVYFAQTPNSQIRLADSRSDQSFVDVPRSNPSFPQIEGMADAGYVIGIDGKHFAPNRRLTREELVAIQVNRYMNGAKIDQPKNAAGMYCVHFGDADQVSKPYWGAFNTDQCTGFSGQDEVHRIFGSVHTLHPRRPVTRAEVAVALQRIAGRTSADALGMQR